MTRVFICVLDGCGAGELPDAAAYGDVGADTLRHVLERSDVELPNLAGLGLSAVVGLPLGAPWPAATYGRLLEHGAGKDTTTGHWEMMGVVLEHPFPTYPHGFPPDVMEPFEQAIGLSGHFSFSDLPARWLHLCKALPEHVAHLVVALHGADVPRERHQVAPVALVGKEVNGRINITSFQRIAERGQESVE